MNINLVLTVNLVLALNCVIIIAKNETESESKLDAKFNQLIYAEGVSQHDNEIDEHKPRIKGRKGVMETPSANEIKSADEDLAPKNISTSAPAVALANSSTPAPVSAINKTTTAVVKPVVEEKSTTTLPPLKTHHINNSSEAPAGPKASTEKISTTTTATTTTKKPIKKPEVTFSADDDPEIVKLEKNINYNVANEKTVEIPKVATDVDRTMLDEKRARSSYMIYLGLVFALPMSFVLINIAYRRVKNYMELRHYQRVDFLVDGMYVS